MALSRKNYLKKSSSIFESEDVKKKDEELFDQLLSSPLKQTVSFQPLSYWKNKIQTSTVKKKTKKSPLWLYESSESEDASPKTLAALDSGAGWSSSESESPDDQTVVDNPLLLQASDTCITDLKNNSLSAADVKEVTDKIDDMTLCNANKAVSEAEVLQALKNDLTNKDLMDPLSLLDCRFVTKRRHYNFSNLCMGSRARDADSASWAYLKSPAREFSYSNETFIAKCRVFASTSYSHNESASPLTHRFVTIRKRHESSRRFSVPNIDAEESFECSRISTVLDLTEIHSPKCDVESQGPLNQSYTIFNDSRSFTNSTFTLKPGKKWRRSISILKHYADKTAGEVNFQNSKIKGKNYNDFVESILGMQNENSRTLNELSISNTSLNLDSSVFGSKIWEAERSLHNPELSKSVCDDTFLEKTFLNRTVKVTQPEDAPSAFRTALGLEQESFIDDSIIEKTEDSNASIISAKDFILNLCNQEDVLSFEEHFNEGTLKDCKKIGEGVYGEVFMCSDTVIKIIPIEGSELVNEEKQKTFEEIISEVVIASKLSNLRNGEEHRTNAYSEMKRCWCVRGKYPKYLLKLWNEYDKLHRSENDSPVMFKEDQLYIILELGNGGRDLESFVFKSSRQSLSIFIQVAFGLAVAERAFEFEHRDLHWGNILVSETAEETVRVTLDNITYEIPTKGVKACIIDFTLSRISHEGCCVFNNLSVDPTLFAGAGDYQFDIYRMMLKEVNGDWSLFRPRNNLFWLHYVVDKMLTMVRYKNKKGKTYTQYRKDLNLLESVVLKYDDSGQFVLSDFVKKFVK